MSDELGDDLTDEQHRPEPATVEPIPFGSIHDVEQVEHKEEDVEEVNHDDDDDYGEDEEDVPDDNDPDDYERVICGFTYELDGGSNSMLAAESGHYAIVARRGGYWSWHSDEDEWCEISATNDDEARAYLRKDLASTEDADWIEISPFGLDE